MSLFVAYIQRTSTCALYPALYRIASSTVQISAYFYTITLALCVQSTRKHLLRKDASRITVYIYISSATLSTRGRIKLALSIKMELILAHNARGSASCYCLNTLLVNSNILVQFIISEKFPHISYSNPISIPGHYVVI